MARDDFEQRIQRIQTEKGYSRNQALTALAIEELKAACYPDEHPVIQDLEAELDECQ